MRASKCLWPESNGQSRPVERGYNEGKNPQTSPIWRPEKRRPTELGKGVGPMKLQTVIAASALLFSTLAVAQATQSSSTPQDPQQTPAQTTQQPAAQQPAAQPPA